MNKIILSIFGIALLVCGACSSGKKGSDSDTDRIVPMASDSIDIWQPGMPTARIGDMYKYGNAEGWNFSRRFPSDSLGIFVDYNVTLLNLNVDIAHELFTLSRNDLRKWGFIAQKDSTPLMNIPRFDSVRYRDIDVMAILLDGAQKEFDANLQELYKIGPNVGTQTEFNARFDIYPIWNTDNYVTYAMRGTAFVGGGHTQQDNMLITFDCISGKPISFREVFKNDDTKKIAELASSHLAGQNIFDNLKTPTIQSYLDSLNNWRRCLPAEDGRIDVCSTRDVTVSSFPLMEPAFTSEGIVMVYPKYSIAPGFAGTPQIVLTYKELKGMFKPPFDKIAEELAASNHDHKEK